MQPAAKQCSIFLVAGLAAITVSAPVMAGETIGGVPVKYFERPVDHWYGAYVGVDLSATGAGGEIGKGAGIKKFDLSQGSVLGGFHAGYNFKPFGGGKNSGWMLGGEFGLAFGGFDKRKTDSVLGNVKMTGNFLASTKLRAGYAWEQAFLYTSVGLGFTDFNLKPVGNRDTDITVGLTYGVGVEVALAEKWTTRLEANVYNFGGRKYRFNGTRRKVDQGMAQLKLGVSYRF